MTTFKPSVGTPPLDLDDTRAVAVTLHRVATRSAFDDQFNVWFADDSVEHCTVPHNPRGSVAEWVEHHVFTTAPESRFQSLTPEAERIDAGADAPVVGQLHVRDEMVVGLALDVDALVGVKTAGDHLAAARIPQPEEEDLVTDGGQPHASNTGTRLTWLGLATGAVGIGITIAGLAWPADAREAPAPPTDGHGQLASSEGMPGTSAGDEGPADEDLATDGGNAHARNVNSIVREQYRVARENGTLDDDLAERFDGGDA